jgi:hypothetical protein
MSSGKTWYRKPTWLVGTSWLEVSTLSAAWCLFVPRQIQHRTEHICGCVLPISLSTSRQVRLLRDPLYSVLYI